MAKDSIRDFSATAGSNTDIQSVNIDENCPASGINNAIRELMVDLKNVSTGAVNLETPAADQLNVDNIRIDGNTISSTDTNGNLTLDPNGTGDTIVSSGNVGIGTASPVSSVNSSAKVVHVKQDSVNGSGFVMESSNCITELLAGNDACYLYNYTPDPIVFGTNNTSRVQIDASGNVGIGTNSPASNTTNLSFRPSTFDRTQMVIGHSNTSSRTVVNFFANGTQGGSINTSPTATSYNTSSDHRLKEAVVNMTGAIDRVKALAPKRFNFIVDPDRTVDGFLAHEAQAVVPEAITGTHNEVDEDGNAVMQGIDQSKLVPLLTGALQEAIAKIETLETQRADLETRLAALEA